MALPGICSRHCFGCTCPIERGSCPQSSAFGRGAENARDGPEIIVRRKVAARGTSDWHGLILGGKALDCQAKIGFRPGPDAHVLDTLGIKVPRCEDSSHVRKDRAYPFVSVLSSLDGPDEAEPGGDGRHLLRYDGGEPVSLDPGTFQVWNRTKDSIPPASTKWFIFLTKRP